MPSVLRRLMNAVETGGISDTRNPALWLEEALSGGKSSSGVNVTVSSAMTLPAYFAGVRAVADDVAKQPRDVFRRIPSGGSELMAKHPVQRIVHLSPNDESTPIVFWSAMISYAINWGNGYAEIIRRGNGQPEALQLIAPSRVEVRRASDDGRIFYRVRNTKNESVAIESADMFHLVAFGDNGITGYSLIHMAKDAIGLGLVGQQFAAQFFGNGAFSSGALVHPAKLSDQAVDNLRKSLLDKTTGDNRWNPMILQEGMEWKQFTIPPEDAQFIEMRQLQIEEYCRLLRIAPHKLQHLLRASFNNIEHLGREYVDDTLMPWAVRIEQECNRKLFGLNEQGELFVKHNFNAILRGDAQARGELYTKMFRMGKSINEIRSLEDENPIGPDGDTRFVTADLVPLDRAIKGPEPKPAATEAKPTSEEPTETPEKPDEAVQEGPERENESAIESRIAHAHERLFNAILAHNSVRIQERLMALVVKQKASDAYELGVSKITASENRRLTDALIPAASTCLESLGAKTEWAEAITEKVVAEFMAAIQAFAMNTLFGADAWISPESIATAFFYEKTTLFAQQLTERLLQTALQEDFRA